MRRKALASERLLVLTLALEAAVEAENWPEVSEIVKARAELIEALSGVSEQLMAEIATIEDRTLTTLRQRLALVRADMRNLSAALRIASPYSTESQPTSLSLAS